MFDKWRKYSYAAQKQRRHRILRAAAWVFSLFLLYSFVSTFLIYSVVIDNHTMRPGLQPGDRLLVSSIGLGSRLPFVDGATAPAALKRGSIVVVVPSRSTAGRNPFFVFANGFIRFFTAQRVDLGGENERMLIKRVVALPGDAVSMIDFVLRVRPAGDSYALTEFELASRPYDLTLPALPEGWGPSVPLSGTMDQLVLGGDECFLVSDDRGNTNDSRTWGATKIRSVVGKAVIRYWPPRRVGRP